ncbi:hypothetical protein PHMEG_00018074 [Phytophthora megakarya]|uniref:Uncharacterized protein n=1 Tax=Phytophthora megakarya TaxID=4795 RepID=A0A225VVQ8_9STRA|nr:hypothetical protein PHMEG_00018074 [Phytophthora megakarya]
MVLRLKELAAERRFKAHQAQLVKQGSRDDEQTMRRQWTDPVPLALGKKYNGLCSYWDTHNKQHEDRLYSLLKEWVMEERFPQGELEARLRFFHFVDHTKESPAATTNACQRGSYLGAVKTGFQQKQQPLTAEQTRLRDMCMAPAQALTQLRERTKDEDNALLMILNHEIEVPAPPNFLVQSMTAWELACFTDIFLAIEYPLYAHLAPGQRFGENLSKQALCAHIYAGAEAAAVQKQEIAEFKQSISRIALDMKTRVITVTFKGKQSASRWVNWKLPLASKLLPLIDYARQREEAKDTNEIIRLDYYTFTVAVRRGALSSQDMYSVLSTEMNLGVHSMTHPVSESTGLNDKEWIVWIKGPCPAWLRSISVILCAEVEIAVHHHEINVNWPCRTCYAPEHPTKYCKVLPETVDRYKHQHTQKIDATLLAKRRSPRLGYGAYGLPKTLAQLKKLLSLKEDRGDKKTTGPQDERKSSRKSRNSPTKKVLQSVESLPTLPKEWGQYKHPETQTAMSHDDQVMRRETKIAGGISRNADAAENQSQAESTPMFTEEGKQSVEAEIFGSSTDENVAVPMDTEEKSSHHVHEYSLGSSELYTNDGTQAWERGRSPTKKPTGTAGLRGKLGRNDKKMRSRQDAKAKQGSSHTKRGSLSPKRVLGDGGVENKRRVVSHSPKRRVPDEWKVGREEDNEIPLCTKAQKREGEARSLSPIKRSTERHKQGHKEAMQRFIHQYMQSTERNGAGDKEAEKKDRGKLSGEAIQSKN